MLFITLIVAGLASIAGGVSCFIKYARTKRRLFLWLAIGLCFVIPAIAFYLAFKGAASPMVAYGPGPMVDYGPMPPVS